MGRKHNVGRLVIGIVILGVGILLISGVLDGYLRDRYMDKYIEAGNSGDILGGLDALDEYVFLTNIVWWFGIALSIIGGLVVLLALKL